MMQVQQQQQIKSDIKEIAEDIKEIREDIQEYRASVRKAVAAKLHITTGDNKDEESIIHLDEEELKTVKSVVETIKDAPPIGVNSWRVGSNVFSIARVGYSALKSLRFLNEHGEEIISFAIGDDDDEADIYSEIIKEIAHISPPAPSSVIRRLSRGHHLSRTLSQCGLFSLRSG
jgi:hypothetical protein